MIIKFQKYQGAGNDFIIMDNRTHIYDLSHQMVKQICDRRFGVGADGMIWLEEEDGYDFRMRYFNSDGYEASLCGNGSRCIVAFARSLGLFENNTRFLASDGEHSAEINGDMIKIKMNDVGNIRITPEYFFMNTGSPHYVKVVPDAFTYGVYDEGKNIRYSKLFEPGGTNVNFITPCEEYIKVATYERGVENETPACGTGCVASALAVAILRHDRQNIYIIKTKGGKLRVSFERNENTFQNIWLEGPATFVFAGEINI